MAAQRRELRRHDAGAAASGTATPRCEFRRDVLKPFFDQYLKDGAPKADTPPVFIYNTGENHWDRLKAWPLACENGCAAKSKAALPHSRIGSVIHRTHRRCEIGGRLRRIRLRSGQARPVPASSGAIRGRRRSGSRWLLTDQRCVADRSDVLDVRHAVARLSPCRVSGAPVVNLVASTSGTDSDWVVKLIDVYPDEVPSQPEMGGYQLSVAMDIFRGRYRESFETPKAIAPNTPLPYKFTLPTVNHVFLPGHRIMVQVQSSWFPLYDRNPQTFVPNIFFAKPEDYVKATQRIYHATGAASLIDLPVASAR